MRKTVLATLMAVLWVLYVGAFAFSFAAEGETKAETNAEPEAQTTADPAIPTAELELMLKAFTKEELLVEADGWQALLREKMVEIGAAEIAVKRQNKEIDKAEEIQSQATKAMGQLEEIHEKAEEAKVTGDAEKIEETEQAAKEAQETVDEIKSSVDEAAEAAEKTAEVRKAIDPKIREGLKDTAEAADKAQEAVGRVQEAAEGMDSGSRASVREAAGKAQEATEEAQDATAVVEMNVEKAVELVGEGQGEVVVIEKTVNAMEEAEEAKREEKVNLLEGLNDSRAERTQLIDNFQAVLDELMFKTDKADADTLAKVTDYRLYIRSVQGIEFDVTDMTSTWIAIKGWLISDEGGLRLARNILQFVGILVVAWMVSGFLSRAVRRTLGIADKHSQLLEDFLVGAVRWIVMALGIIMALAAMEISVGPLLAIVGAAGFVIAFALQDSLSNFASGIMILFFRPFDVGDVVEAGGVSGKVVKMNLVATTIKTFDNKDMVVPNNKIWQDVITNATGVRTRRVDMEFGIGYDDDIDQAQAILEDIVEQHPKALEKPEPTVRMTTLADSSVNFICRPWSKTEDYWDVYWDVTKAVKQRFDAAGIGIPFPQRDVHLYIEDGAAKPAKETVAAVTSGKTSADRSNPQPLGPDEDERVGGTEG